MKYYYYLLDSSFWIEWWKAIDLIDTKKLSAIERIHQKITQAPSLPFINGIILFEVLRGLSANKHDQHKLKAINSIRYMETPRKVHINAAQIAHVLDQKGRSIPQTDCIIAATAIEYKAILVTGDNHFKRIPQLKTLLL